MYYNTVQRQAIEQDTRQMTRGLRPKAVTTHSGSRARGR